MNVFSKDYNPYLSSQLRGVSERELANPVIEHLAWDMLVDTIQVVESRFLLLT